MQIHIDQRHRELKMHGTYAFPVRITQKHLSDYHGGSFFWHWHPEPELTLVCKGQMLYQVNDRVYSLSRGQGLFCNANMPHTGRMDGQSDCQYISVTFDPRVVYGYEGSLLQLKYLSPLLADSSLCALHLTAQQSWQKQLLCDLEKIWAYYQSEDETAPYHIALLLSGIFLTLYEQIHPCRDEQQSSRERERLIAVLTYLHDHYSEKLSLSGIAAQVNLCQSECCRFFKRLMGQSLFEYLMRYRLEQSLSMLLKTNLSIGDIATCCGFSTPSYFTHHSHKAFGITPKAYRTCHGTL